MEPIVQTLINPDKRNRELFTFYKEVDERANLKIRSNWNAVLLNYYIRIAVYSNRSMPRFTISAQAKPLPPLYRAEFEHLQCILSIMG